jgi:large subunit ribosomal protein L22
MSSATLKNYRQSPRKVRRVAHLVRGKSVAEALSTLQFTVKRPADPLMKLIASAAENAKNLGEKGDMVISSIRVDQGKTLKRMMPRARGSSAPIRKRSSVVTVILSPAKAK